MGPTVQVKVIPPQRYHLFFLKDIQYKCVESKNHIRAGAVTGGGEELFC